MVFFQIVEFSRKTKGFGALGLCPLDSQSKNKEFKKNNFAYREINLPIINEFSIGQLMAMSIIETVAACLYFKVLDFDQPVEKQGKKLTKQYLVHVLFKNKIFVFPYTRSFNIERPLTSSKDVLLFVSTIVMVFF